MASAQRVHVAPMAPQTGRRRSGTKVQRQRCKGKQWVIDVARLLPAPNDPLSLSPRSRTPHLLEHQATTIARRGSAQRQLERTHDLQVVVRDEDTVRSHHYVLERGK